MGKGKGYAVTAVTAGMLIATGEYSLMCDADLSVPIEDFLSLIPPITYGDVVIRIKGERRCTQDWRALVSTFI